MYEPAQSSQELREGVIAKVARVGSESASQQPLMVGLGILQDRMGTRFFFDGESIETDPSDLHPGDEVSFLAQPGPLSRATRITKRISHHDSRSASSEYGPRPESPSFSPSFPMDQHPPASDSDAHAILQQTRVNHATLQNSIASVLVALDWKAGEAISRRRVATVSQSLEGFHQQLKQAFASEEQDGFCTLDFVATRQSLCSHLLGEHRAILESLSTIAEHLRQEESLEQAAFEKVQYDMRRVVIAVENHLRREADLISAEFGVDISAD